MAEPLKNVYTREFVESIGKHISEQHSRFDCSALVNSVFTNDWDALELKARMTRICSSIHATLKLPYAEAIAVLNNVVPHFGSYEAMLFPEFIQAYGLDDWETSLPALAHFTQYSSSEFAVRPYIEQDPERMMAQMLTWADSDNYHVRRLASEGCRPRLPWAPALPAFKQDPGAIFPILEKLKCDDEDYVRRSVANNLNDISKDHPDLVLKWCQDNIGQHKHTDWIIKHACRGLLKESHPIALALFGYQAPHGLSVASFSVNKTEISEGDHLQVSASIAAPEKLGKLRVEYIVHYIKANGSASPKVFIFSEGEFAEARKLFTRRHSFERMTTRVHYPGEHKIELRVNGWVLAETSVLVTG
ncbi:MAG: DNA alkylation repair protein [Gammaproteobacteria bacterium]|nr:DNA alkylation repair protein [Gammaproteobacteria bacterium]